MGIVVVQVADLFFISLAFVLFELAMGVGRRPGLRFVCQAWDARTPMAQASGFRSFDFVGTIARYSSIYREDGLFPSFGSPAILRATVRTALNGRISRHDKAALNPNTAVDGLIEIQKTETSARRA